LRDVWGTAPYLHDGSAATLADAVSAHRGITVSAADLQSLTSYLQQIGSEEASAPVNVGAGLTGRYYQNTTLSGNAALTRVENINFNWGNASPGTGIAKDKFSVRWSGFIQVPTTGSYRFRTVSDDGVRLWVNAVQRINNWTNHSAKTDTSAAVTLTAGVRYAITMEYYDNGGQAVAQLSWQLPGASSYVIIPANNLYAN
jgi:hypothetical protein